MGFASRAERALVASVVRDDFGETAARVAALLLRAEGLRLAEIAQRLRAASSAAASAAPPPSLHEVKCALLKLLQHNALDVRPVGGARAAGQPAVTYNVRILRHLAALTGGD